MKKTLLLSSSLLAALSFSVLAKEPSFNYVEAGFASGFKSDDADGFELATNIDIDSSFYFTADITSKDLKSKTEKYSHDVYGLGIGYKFALDGKTTLFSHIDYLKSKISGKKSRRYHQQNGKNSINIIQTKNEKTKGNGYRFGVGIKSSISEQLQVSAEIRYNHINFKNGRSGTPGAPGVGSNGGVGGQGGLGGQTFNSNHSKKSDTTLRLGANYQLSGPTSVFGTIESDFDEAHTYSVGLRYSF
jgi:opacity protein-like surface antigen